MTIFDATRPLSGEAYLAFGDEPAGWRGKLKNLSPGRDLREVFSTFFKNKDL